jgi:hypothetical protein
MGNIRFLQLTLIGMRNFAIPGRNAHDYYRNKLTLNIAGTLLKWHTDTYTAVRRCWKTY